MILFLVCLGVFGYMFVGGIFDARLKRGMPDSGTMLAAVWPLYSAVWALCLLPWNAGNKIASSKDLIK